MQNKFKNIGYENYTSYFFISWCDVNDVNTSITWKNINKYKNIISKLIVP